MQALLNRIWCHLQSCEAYRSVHGRPSSFVQKMVVRTQAQHSCQNKCGPHIHIGCDSNCAAYGHSECVRTMLVHTDTLDVLEQWRCVQTQWMGLMQSALLVFFPAFKGSG